jgi:hypothetical protein
MARDRKPSRSRHARFTVPSVATPTIDTTALVEMPVSAAAKPKGHDVSSHQKNVNWPKAKSKGARFVYLNPPPADAGGFLAHAACGSATRQVFHDQHQPG